MSFSVVVCTNRSEYFSSALRRSTMPSISVPSTSRARRVDRLRRAPRCASARSRRSSPSRSRPGSMILWQPAQNGRVGVQPHLLAQRARMVLRAGLLLERRHDRRRRRHRRADDVLEHPHAALHGRRALRQRRHEQDAAVAQDAAARLVLDGHAAEIAAVDALHAVVARETVVDERVVGRQKIEQVAVLAHDAREQHLGLGAEGLPQIVVEAREVLDGAALGLQVAQVEPLAGEVLDERVRASDRRACAALACAASRARGACRRRPARAARRRGCCSRGRTTGATRARRSEIR